MRNPLSPAPAAPTAVLLCFTGVPNNLLSSSSFSLIGFSASPPTPLTLLLPLLAATPPNNPPVSAANTLLPLPLDGALPTALPPPFSPLPTRLDPALETPEGSGGDAILGATHSQVIFRRWRPPPRVECNDPMRESPRAPPPPAPDAASGPSNPSCSAIPAKSFPLPPPLPLAPPPNDSSPSSSASRFLRRLAQQQQRNRSARTRKKKQIGAAIAAASWDGVRAWREVGEKEEGEEELDEEGVEESKVEEVGDVGGVVEGVEVDDEKAEDDVEDGREEREEGRLARKDETEATERAEKHSDQYVSRESEEGLEERTG